MKVRVDIVIFWSVVGLTIISACLIAVWRGFSIFTGLFMLVASVLFTYWSYLKHRNYSTKVEQIRFEDAYIYADENYTNFDPQNYTYSKKEERQINIGARNFKSMIFVGVVLCLASILLIVFGFQMVI